MGNVSQEDPWLLGGLRMASQVGVRGASRWNRCLRNVDMNTTQSDLHRPQPEFSKYRCQATIFVTVSFPLRKSCWHEGKGKRSLQISNKVSHCIADNFDDAAAKIIKHLISESQREICKLPGTGFSQPMSCHSTPSGGFELWICFMCWTGFQTWNHKGLCSKFVQCGSGLVSKGK